MITNMSYKELVRKTNICPANARRILANKDVALETADRVAKALEVPFENLFEKTYGQRALLKI